MSDIWFVVFLVYSKLLFYVIATCPPANEQSLKLMEIVSSNPLSTLFSVNPMQMLAW
jgi:hypothetical protein